MIRRLTCSLIGGGLLGFGLLGLGIASAVAAPLELDGEIVARHSAALVPPTVEDQWQLNITMLLAEGTVVQKGTPVIGFDGAMLQQKLQQKQAELNERQSQQQQLALQLDERERNDRLAVEEARANRDKAQRKAEQPAELIARIDYRKLVVERQQAERKYALAQQREALSREQRTQEARLLRVQVDRLREEVKSIEETLAKLNVVAPRDGVVLHKSNWQGEKFEVGSQVHRGQTVAEIPDMNSLSVHAVLPEAEFRRIAVGQAVKVRVDGTGLRLDGRVEEIGRVIRSKSRLQPVPVVDVEVQIIGRSDGLKPGQAVRVEIADD